MGKNGLSLVMVTLTHNDRTLIWLVKMASQHDICYIWPCDVQTETEKHLLHWDGMLSWY